MGVVAGERGRQVAMTKQVRLIGVGGTGRAVLPKIYSSRQRRRKQRQMVLGCDQMHHHDVELYSRWRFRVE